MNLSSFILLLVIAAITGYGIYRIKRSKGACDDCDVVTCPVHEMADMNHTEHHG